jgi:hypothetical protein
MNDTPSPKALAAALIVVHDLGLNAFDDSHPDVRLVANSLDAFAAEAVADAMRSCTQSFGSKGCALNQGHTGPHISRSGSQWPNDTAHRKDKP